MAQCPVPAVPQQPVLIMRADHDLTADEVADIRRRLAATMASPQIPVVMVEPRELMEPGELFAQVEDPSLRAPIYGPSHHHVRRFVQRWKYTIGLCLGTAAATGLLLLTEPANWWVPVAFVAVMLVVCWPGWHRR